MRITTRWSLLAIGAALFARAAVAQPVCDAGGPYTVLIPSPIQFDGTGSSAPGGTIASYQWDFGDGTTGTGPTPLHTYASLDVFEVTLMVMDDHGASSTCETTAKIFGEPGPPTCDMGGPYFGTADEPVQFDGTGSSDPDGEIVAYAWWFGDGSVGFGTTPQHTYAMGGTYFVMLTVTDDDEASITCKTTAEINPLIVEPATWGRIKHIYR